MNIGTEEGIVHDDHDPMTMCHCGNLPDVHQAQRRVAGAFNPYEFSLVRPDELRNIDLDARRERDLDVMGRGHFGKVAMGATIDVRDGNHMRALRE